MSTFWSDPLRSLSVRAGLSAREISTTSVGPVIDLGDSEGPILVVHSVGELSAGSTLEILVEESADGTTWASTADASIDEIVEGGFFAHLRFTRTQRYLRVTANFTAGSSNRATIAVAFLARRKLL
jgi:hypothetical protein